MPGWKITLLMMKADLQCRWSDHLPALPHLVPCQQHSHMCLGSGQAWEALLLTPATYGSSRHSGSASVGGWELQVTWAVHWEVPPACLLTFTLGSQPGVSLLQAWAK
jgi:hypothetical protein